MTSFLTQNELLKIGFKSVGENVLVSKNAQFYGTGSISIGNNVRIDDFCILSGHIEIGNYIHIAAYSALYAGEEPIIIRDFANLSSRVSVYAKTDDYSGNYMTNPMVPEEFTNIYEKPVTISKHVIIGASSVVLPGVFLGEGVAIGSCSLILKDCEPWGIYAGMPAKRIKKRNEKILELEKNLVN